MRSMTQTMALCGVTCGLFVATASAQVPYTHPSVLVEEFTAEWCNPCVGAYYALERAKDRWGDEISQLTYSIADRYENAPARLRDSELGVYAIPTFWFQGTYVSVGTPSDGQIDNWIRSCQDQAPKAQILGNWVVDMDREVIQVNIKVQAEETLSSNYELRIMIWEDNWEVYNSNGLPDYHYHVQDAFYETIGPLNAGEQARVIEIYDLSANPWIHDWNEVGITVYLHDRSNNRSVHASWNLGEVSLGDLNGDLNLNRQDVQLFRAAFGSTRGQGRFNEAADFDRNGIINMADRDLAVEYVRGGGMR